ncbi:MAG: hypothetical protein JWO32_1523 [Bacteroidetes bacterium]|nr:hypothetical protein [Bacteroidota bacterium]
MGKNGRVSIFIVEDNSLYTYFLNETLKEEGDFNITTFETAQQCLDSLNEKPDLIVLDYYLEKGITGMDTFKQIHAKNPKLPVIILSSQDDVQIAADLLEAGVYEYIEKKDKQVVDKLKKAILEISHKAHHEYFKDFWAKKIKTKNIFIVEDNAPYAKALELYLKASFPDATEIKIFPVAEVAIMELDRKNPSVIVMDYFLDGRYYDAETGIEAIKEIKAIKPEIKIILLTSQGEINVALEATNKYHCHYVKKDEHAFHKVESFIREVWA